jgi:hypothetical protein
MRNDVNQANNAATTAGNTAAGYGAGASTISSNLVPFETRQLTNPSGYSQQDIGSMLTKGLAGAGGATAGLAGAASKNAATARNPMGFSAALDAAARSRDKAAASTSEGIAADNAGVKMNQQQQAGDILGKMYSTDVSGQNSASSQIAPDVNAAVNASKSGWLQNLMNGIKTVGGAAGGAGQLLSGLASQGISV